MAFPKHGRQEQRGPSAHVIIFGSIFVGFLLIGLWVYTSPAPIEEVQVVSQTSNFDKPGRSDSRVISHDETKDADSDDEVEDRSEESSDEPVKREEEGPEVDESTILDKSMEEQKAEEDKAKAEEAKAKAKEAKAKAEEAKAKAEESKAKAEEAKAEEDDTKAEEAEAKSEDAKAKAEEAKAKAEEAKAKFEEVEAEGEEAEAEAKSEKTKDKLEEGKTEEFTSEDVMAEENDDEENGNPKDDAQVDDEAGDSQAVEKDSKLDVAEKEELSEGKAKKQDAEDLPAIEAKTDSDSDDQVSSSWKSQAKESKDEKEVIKNNAADEGDPEVMPAVPVPEDTESTTLTEEEEKIEASQQLATTPIVIKEEPVETEVEKYKWRLCQWDGAQDYIPCLDNKKWLTIHRRRKHYEHRERHCPTPEEMPKCLVPLPPGYRAHIKWPDSRSEVCTICDLFTYLSFHPQYTWLSLMLGF